MRINFLKAPNLPTDADTGGPLWRMRGHKVHEQGSASGVDFPSVPTRGGGVSVCLESVAPLKPDGRFQDC